MSDTHLIGPGVVAAAQDCVVRPIQPYDTQPVGLDFCDPAEPITFAPSGSARSVQPGGLSLRVLVLGPHAIAVLGKGHHVAYLGHVRRSAPELWEHHADKLLGPGGHRSNHLQVLAVHALED